MDRPFFMLRLMRRVRYAAVPLLIFALAGCGGTENLREETKKNEALVEKGCPSIEVAAEGKCETAAAIQEAKANQPGKEAAAQAAEAEQVLKKRRAEELANAAEAAG